MDLRQLNYFVAVSETGSFTGAARRMHVVQSGLSATIRALERELGAELFHRTTRRVDLTEAGQALLVDARRILASVEQARSTVDAVAGGVRGSVKFGIMHSLIAAEVLDALATFHRERPHVRLLPHTHPAGSAGLVQAVVDGEIDFAIAAPPPEQTAVDLVPLRSERMVLICPPDHRLAARGRVRLEELIDEPFIDVPPGWGSRASTDRLCASLGLPRNVEIEVGDVATVVDLVRAGLGVALIAPTSAPPTTGLPTLDTLPAPSFDVSLVLPKTRRLGPAAHALTTAVLAHTGRVRPRAAPVHQAQAASD
ncbi:LysR family transcriptional regulator [Nocardia alni]|uniref:LysR family transcriptional regulator n=1 Tax=Nocardia alni TaxID=2815723 RepID=UPI001C219DBD|nr:LysR family transcriptional regulator [Nocardia alni]